MGSEIQISLSLGCGPAKCIQSWVLGQSIIGVAQARHFWIIVVVFFVPKNGYAINFVGTIGTRLTIFWVTIGKKNQIFNPVTMGQAKKNSWNKVINFTKIVLFPRENKKKIREIDLGIWFHELYLAWTLKKNSSPLCRYQLVNSDSELVLFF